MRSRLVIAALGGLVIGLTVLVLFQARLIREARRELVALDIPLPERPTNTGQRPVRLRLQDIPPIAIRTQVQQLDWRTVESEDYATYVANLRRIGCPEETIRDILLADIDKLYGARRRALSPPPTNTSYWLPPEEDPARVRSVRERQEREAELAALERERRQLVGALLGEGATQAEFAELVEEGMNDADLQFLDPAKRRSLAEAQARYRQAMDDLDAVADADQRRALELAAEKAVEEAMAAALSPEERLQLEYRTSPLAEDLREKLRGFGASREEFEQLFRLESDFAKEREALEKAGAQGTDPQWQDKIEAAGILLEEAIGKALGPERFAEFERTRDPDFQTLYGLAQMHDMPPTVAREVWDMRQTVAQHTETIRNNPLLTPDQKRAALEAVRAETQSAIVEVLGEPLLLEYQRQGGAWLADLTDPELVASTAPPPAETVEVQTPTLPPLPGVVPFQPVPFQPVPLQPIPILPAP